MSLLFRKRQRSLSVDGEELPPPSVSSLMALGSSSTSSQQISDAAKWSDMRDVDLFDLMGMATKIRGILTSEQTEAYQIVFRIEEISQKLRHDKFVHVPPSRDPPPPPQYDATGKRINTPEYIYKKQLENERHWLVEVASRCVPGYNPPLDYKKPSKLVEKLFIPVKDYPEINFIGLLIGPRGNTLKKLQEFSGARIAIRGKGSVKEGKNRSVNERQNNLDEDLHCLITADDEEKLKKGLSACQDVIDKAVFTPEGQNDLKRGQLRELAAINGTLREYEERPCPNCGELGHKRYDCPNKKLYLETVVCRICGNTGHFARDCKMRGNNYNGNFNNNNNANMIPTSGNGNLLTNAEQEYMQMMKELNFDVGQYPGGPQGPAGAITNGPPADNEAPVTNINDGNEPQQSDSYVPANKRRNLGPQDQSNNFNTFNNNGSRINDNADLPRVEANSQGRYNTNNNYNSNNTYNRYDSQQQQQYDNYRSQQSLNNHYNHNDNRRYNNYKDNSYISNASRSGNYPNTRPGQISSTRASSNAAAAAAAISAGLVAPPGVSLAPPLPGMSTASVAPPGLPDTLSAPPGASLLPPPPAVDEVFPPPPPSPPPPPPPPAFDNIPNDEDSYDPDPAPTSPPPPPPPPPI